MRTYAGHVFKNLGADNMFKLVRQSVFEFIKHIEPEKKVPTAAT